MRTTRKLTERQIRVLKPAERPYKVADGEGLYLLTSHPPAAGRGGSSTATAARRNASHSVRGPASRSNRPAR